MNTDRLKVKTLTVGDNPEWVEGYYRPPAHAGYAYGRIENRDGLRKIDVDTLCQCTGLKDSNGGLIYEGDEIVVKDFRPHPEAEFDPLAGDFDEYQNLQGFIQYHRYGMYCIDRGHSAPFNLFSFPSNELTLTGKNIHDIK